MVGIIELNELKMNYNSNDANFFQYIQLIKVAKGITLRHKDTADKKNKTERGSEWQRNRFQTSEL